ncbi:MAG: hypothetical protein PVSMB1_06380 [Gemmatimonadaceae bacterium]
MEESDEEEIRRMFEINFFGLTRMTRAVLPIMRRQRAGHIVNISSIGGLRSFPTLAYYNATKYAVEGFSEALALEVAPLGIKVTIVEPSGFRTDWAGRSAAESKNRIADYAPTAGKNLQDIRGYSGKQPGDPCGRRRRSLRPWNLRIRRYDFCSAKRRSKARVASSTC